MNINEAQIKVPGNERRGSYSADASAHQAYNYLVNEAGKDGVISEQEMEIFMGLLFDSDQINAKEYAEARAAIAQQGFRLSPGAQEMWDIFDSRLQQAGANPSMNAKEADGLTVHVSGEEARKLETEIKAVAARGGDGVSEPPKDEPTGGSKIPHAGRCHPPTTEATPEPPKPTITNREAMAEHILGSIADTEEEIFRLMQIDPPTAESQAALFKAQQKLEKLNQMWEILQKMVEMERERNKAVIDNMRV